MKTLIIVLIFSFTYGIASAQQNGLPEKDFKAGDGMGALNRDSSLHTDSNPGGKIFPENPYSISAGAERAGEWAANCFNCAMDWFSDKVNAWQAGPQSSGDILNAMKNTVSRMQFNLEAKPYNGKLAGELADLFEKQHTQMVEAEAREAKARAKANKGKGKNSPVPPMSDPLVLAHQDFNNNQQRIYRDSYQQWEFDIACDGEIVKMDRFFPKALQAFFDINGNGVPDCGHELLISPYLNSYEMLSVLRNEYPGVRVQLVVNPQINTWEVYELEDLGIRSINAGGFITVANDCFGNKKQGHYADGLLGYVYDEALMECRRNNKSNWDEILSKDHFRLTDYNPRGYITLDGDFGWTFGAVIGNYPPQETKKERSI